MEKPGVCISIKGTRALTPVLLVKSLQRLGYLRRGKARLTVVVTHCASEAGGPAIPARDGSASLKPVAPPRFAARARSSA